MQITVFRAQLSRCQMLFYRNLTRVNIQFYPPSLVESISRETRGRQAENGGWGVGVEIPLPQGRFSSVFLCFSSSHTTFFRRQGRDADRLDDRVKFVNIIKRRLVRYYYFFFFYDRYRKGPPYYRRPSSHPSSKPIRLSTPATRFFSQ